MGDRVSELALRFRVDESATAQLIKAFTERVRYAQCDFEQDMGEMSEHLGASNKPSAQACKMLGDIRSGKPLGPCRFKRSSVYPAHGKGTYDEQCNADKQVA